MISFYVCLVAITTITLILFMPALFELKKPKDNGPRQIIGVKLVYTGPLMWLEEEAKVEQPQVNKLTCVLTVLPNLEVDSYLL